MPAHSPTPDIWPVGLCPGNRESGGKRFSGRVRKANRYVKRALCQAAWAASYTRETYLPAFFRRMSVRKGAPKAVMALAHHIVGWAAISMIGATSRRWWGD